MYARDPDPWSFERRWYDRRKYQLTVAALRRARYRSGFEPACSIGVLSAVLAERCDRLLCTDLVDVAVEQARERLAGKENVTVRQAALPEWPDGRYDLIVLSEVLYYLPDEHLATVIDGVRRSLVPGGDLVVVHWQHPVPQHRPGGEAHELLCATEGLVRVAGYTDPDFRLDVFTPTPAAPASVAEAEGLWP
jgi:SAM-dependent methyltransferase